MTRKFALLIVAAGLVLFGAAACGTDEGQDAATSPAKTTEAIAADPVERPTDLTDEATEDSTPATSLPASVSYGPAVLVWGQEECEINPPIAAGTTTTDSDGTVHTRDGEFKCTVTNSDPRIAGTAYYTANLDRWATSPTEGAQVQWGTIRIENGGGAWETEYLGIYSDRTGDVGAELYVGTGGYEGLYYYQWVIGTFEPPWQTQGLIFPTTVQLPRR